MAYIVKVVEEYIFGGRTQRELAVADTVITGTATQQASGSWTWFLRYPDGEYAGEGGARSWDGVEHGIARSLIAEMKYGRLKNLPGPDDVQD